MNNTLVVGVSYKSWGDTYKTLCFCRLFQLLVRGPYTGSCRKIDSARYVLLE
jgi:hypothetical protein